MRDRVRTDLGAGRNTRRALEDGERLDGGVGLELDGVVDPGRLRIDDGDAGQQVPLVDPVAEGGGGLGEVGARVHAGEADRVGFGAVRDRAASGRDDAFDRVGEVELALRVVCVELLQRTTERRGVEDVVGGIELFDGPLLVGCVPLLDDSSRHSRFRLGRCGRTGAESVR